MFHSFSNLKQVGFSIPLKRFHEALAVYIEATFQRNGRVSKGKETFDLVHALGQIVLFSGLVINVLFESSALEKKNPKALRPLVQDIWGERRLGK